MTTSINNTVSTVFKEVVFTPAPTCHLIYTTEAAEDCEEYTYTTFIGTTDSVGGYINATLVVIETPVLSLCPLPTGKTSDIPSIVIPSISASSLSSLLIPTATPVTATPSPTKVSDNKPGLPNESSLTFTATSTTLKTITSCSDHNCNGVGGGDQGHTTTQGVTVTKDTLKANTTTGGVGSVGGDAGAQESTGTVSVSTNGENSGEGTNSALAGHPGEQGGATGSDVNPTSLPSVSQPVLEYPTGSGSRLELMNSYILALATFLALII
ncbi:hypothetical protein CANINC_005026 [Pichia inconspicua]|uniref:Uncharacterized protein n=1 Tax=Pichia inconspicua TaxID=52247 RepID=A0A4T0WUH4_9ASCO|nr:hypothetical protein CANINC_005026 [[Candida] inconspicua]